MQTRTHLPDFHTYSPSFIAQQLTAQLATAKATQTAVGNNSESATWANTVHALQAITEPLSQTWGLANHLQSVCDTTELRDCVNRWLPTMSEFFTALGQDLKLLARYENLQAQAEILNLNAAQRKVLSNAIRDFELSGAKLIAPQREQFAEHASALAQAQQTFSEHVLDATNAFEHHCTYATDLAGLPADELVARAQAAKAKGNNGFLITLHMPSYLPVMQYCKNRGLREILYRAYATRASELGAAAHDNTALLQTILQLRASQAQLLGFKNYAEVSLAAKMANTPNEVETFLLDLANKAKPGAEYDLQILKKHAREQLGIDDLQAWDMAFVSEHLRQSQYAYSDHEVKQYFQEPKVFEGLFTLIERMFGVRFVVHTSPVWHKSVRAFALQKDAKTIAYLYVDPYAREGKRGGAWMNSLASRHVLPDGTVQLPTALIVCNAAQPVGDKPALLSHDEVITLFHEFGHALHHVLTQVDELAVSGIDGVEWDAVELPSQMMENFCWEYSVVQAMTAHVETGEAMPRALFDKLLAAKNFQSGLGMLRQLEFSLFDMRLHEKEPTDDQIVAQTLRDVRNEIAVIQPPSFNRFAHSFGHIFSGGYAAGYYSYKWAEVLSADAYSAFEEAGEAHWPSTGARYRDQILSVGGSRPAIESFTAFRGRTPTVDALLRHNGLAEVA